MKTLIVHPSDNSTTFLDIVYAKVKNKTVINGGVTYQELVELIQSHDRIMMMGHGSPQGLFSIGQFSNNYGMIIDNNMAEILRPKTENVFIWCNADMYVNHHQLSGFYSGMFISEVGEAVYCGLPGMSQDIVDESNYGFVNILGECINQNKNNIYRIVKQEYGKIAENNPVAFYNYLRLYKR